VLGKCGGYMSDVADAIRWSAGVSVPGVPDNAHPARVLNLSLSGSACDDVGVALATSLTACVCPTTYQNAINDALAADAIVVVAAGNKNQPADKFSPANCNGVITVGATGRGGQRASYSNHGPLVEISAPGGSDGKFVLSTANNGVTSPDTGIYTYIAYQGTSMATPHVVGVAALLLTGNPYLKRQPDQLAYLLMQTAVPLASTQDCGAYPGAQIPNAVYGHGRVDASAAYTLAIPIFADAFE